VQLIAIPDKNRAVLADFLFFGSYGEIKLGTKNFNFFGGRGVVSSSLVGCGGVSAFLGGGGVEDSDGAGEGCGLGDGGGDGGSGIIGADGGAKIREGGGLGRDTVPPTSGRDDS